MDEEDESTLVDIRFRLVRGGGGKEKTSSVEDTISS